MEDGICLQQLWNSYCTKFNETKVQEQFDSLKRKLENYQRLKTDVHDALMNHQNLHTTIPVIRKAIEEQEAENRSTVDHRKRLISSMNIPSMFC
jgi:hypothetical protein